VQLNIQSSSGGNQSSAGFSKRGYAEPMTAMIDSSKKEFTSSFAQSGVRTTSSSTNARMSADECSMARFLPSQRPFGPSFRSTFTFFNDFLRTSSLTSLNSSVPSMTSMVSKSCLVCVLMLSSNSETSFILLRLNEVMIRERVCNVYRISASMVFATASSDVYFGFHPSLIALVASSLTFGTSPGQPPPPFTPPV